MSIRVAVTAAVVALLAGPGAPGPAGAQELVLTGARIVDVETGEIRRDVTIEIRDGRIEGITQGEPGDAGEAERIDLEGRYVAPGLMDAHVHLGSEEQALRALRSGVTTVRSAGVSHYVDVGLRELVAAGHAEGPEVLATGYHVRPGVADALFLDHPDLGRFRGEPIESDAAIRAVVAANLERDVDWVKTTSTERAGLPMTDPRTQLYDEEQVGAMVDEAGAAGLGVMAHAHGDAGARAAIAGGVRSIEHGTYMSPATLDLMAERGTFYVPTIAIVGDLTDAGGDYDDATLRIRGRHMLTRLRETVSRAHERGIRIVASTDTGYGPGSTTRLAHELIEFVEHAGMTPLEALRSATAVAAELFGIQDRTGRIAEGMEADLIVLERDPLEEIDTVQDVLLVVSDGDVVVRRGGW